MEIISGGQTGADQGGLEAGRILGLKTGGVCPLGWITENGPEEEKLKNYGLTQFGSSSYPPRTEMNVLLSDATLIIGRFESKGAGLTIKMCEFYKKPVHRVMFPASWFYLDEFRLYYMKGASPYISVPSRRDFLTSGFKYWLKENRINVINVAGNRESLNPGIFEFTRDFIVDALS